MSIKLNPVSKQGYIVVCERKSKTHKVNDCTLTEPPSVSVVTGVSETGPNGEKGPFLTLNPSIESAETFELLSDAETIYNACKASNLITDYNFGIFKADVKIEYSPVDVTENDDDNSESSPESSEPTLHPSDNIDKITEDVTKRVIGIVANSMVVDVESVKIESNLIDDLGADELDRVEAIIDIEGEFGICIYDYEEEKISTVGDIVNLVLKKAYDFKEEKSS